MCDPGGALTVSTAASSSLGADVDVDEAAPVFARPRWARRIDPSSRLVRTIDGDALVAKCEQQLVVLTPMVLVLWDDWPGFAKKEKPQREKPLSPPNPTRRSRPRKGVNS
jgi:hypothetical protein